MTGGLIVLVVGPHGLSSVRLTTGAWKVTAGGRLIVTAPGAPAAEFAAGMWAGVMNDDHVDAGLGEAGLLAARRALGNIAAGVGAGWLTDLRRIERIARDGLLEVQHEQVTEP